MPPRDREFEEASGSGTSKVPLLIAVLLVLGLMGGGIAFVLLMQPDDPPRDRDPAPRVADKDKPEDRPGDDGEPRPGPGKEPDDGDGPGIKKEDTNPKPPEDNKSGERKPPNDGEKKPPDDGEKTPPPPPPPPPKEPHAPFVGHASPILNVAFSRDFRLALSGSGGLAQGGLGVVDDTSLRQWDAKTGQERTRLRNFRAGISAVAFAPDGRYALFAAAGKVVDAAFTPGGDFDLHLWDLQGNREVRALAGHRDEVLCISFSPDGKHAISGGRDKIGRVWEVETGSEVQRLVGHTNTINSVAIAPDSKHALSGSSDQTVRYWELQRGTEVRQLTGHKDIVWAVAFSPNGKRGLSAGGFQAAPDGKGLVPGTKDFAVRLWEVATDNELRRFEGHTSAVSCVIFSADGRRVLSAGADRTVRLWQTETGRELRQYMGHTKPILSVAFSPDGKRALSGGEDGQLRPWALPLDVPDLVKLLRDTTDAKARAKALEELALYGPEARDAIHDLLGALKGADAELRRATLATLGKIGKPLPGHAALLVPLARGDAGLEARLYALESLAALGSHAKVGLDVLAAAMKEKEPAVRLRAAAALCAIGPEARTTAYPLLLDALRDADNDVAAAATTAVEKLGPPTKSEVPALIDLLKDQPVPVRRHALVALASLKNDAQKAAPTVAGLVTGDSSAELRKEAVRALLAIRPQGEESVEVFSRAAEDSDAGVARQAVAALAQVGVDAGALPALLRALGHADAEVAKAADEAVRKVRWSRPHARDLGTALGTMKAAIRPRLLEALTKIGGDAGEAVPGLRALLKRADEKEQLQVLATLTAIGPPAKAAGPDVAALLKPKPTAKEMEGQIEVCLALTRIEAEEAKDALPVMVSALRIEDEEEASLQRRERVAKELIRVGKPVVPHLVKAIEGEFYIGTARSKDYLVRAAARLKIIFMLAEIGPKDAGTKDVLDALARVERIDRIPELKKAAGDAYAKLSGKKQP